MSTDSARPARPPRPAEVCRQLLASLGAAEGRRRKRKRDTTPDALGLEIKRLLLEEAARADPDPDAFEAWLLERSLAEPASGPARAMAMAILEEWRLAGASGAFADWLRQGAPSDDAGSG
ncbi:MAG: hypothetical protein ACREMR_01070 [Gemmatimonadales bacterium]